MEKKKEKSLMPSEQHSVTKKTRGEYWDEIYERDADGNEVLVEQTQVDHNMIVDKIGELIAAFMKGEAGISGILYHALGHGDPSWDTSVPPPSSSQTTLTDEYYRKTPDSIQFVDGSGNPVAYVTNRILITTTFDFGEATGSIREQGLFGGDATAALDSGYMLNVIRHAEVYKDSTRKIVRRIRITFS